VLLAITTTATSAPLRGLILQHAAYAPTLLVAAGRKLDQSDPDKYRDRYGVGIAAVQRGMTCDHNGRSRR
jgi:hypothetical protein